MIYWYILNLGYCGGIIRDIAISFSEFELAGKFEFCDSNPDEEALDPLALNGRILCCRPVG